MLFPHLKSALYSQEHLEPSIEAAGLFIALTYCAGFDERLHKAGCLGMWTWPWYHLLPNPQWLLPKKCLTEGTVPEGPSWWVWKSLGLSHVLNMEKEAV